MFFKISLVSIQWFRFFSILCFLCFIPNKLSAQTTLSGKVIDVETQEPLAFAHLIVNTDKTGVMTDIDGRFTVSYSEITSLTCSYVGYKTKQIHINSNSNTENIVIQLDVNKNELDLVELTAKENPAYRIIRQVIKNKEKHNPEHLNTFKYECYNKVIYDFIYGDSQDADSLKQGMDDVLNGGHMLISESITERKYKSPNYSEETILATRFSGIKNPSFTSLATDLQPFSFYNDIISFLDVNYLNPISNGSLQKYQYYLRDTLYHETDTTFVINYYPRKGKNFDGLKGLLYVNTNGYAIENVIAEPYETGKINLKIQQKYTKLNSGVWFPEQLNYTLRFQEYPSKDVQIGVDGKSYISKVKLDEDFSRKDFSIDQVKISPLATKQETTYWNSHRPIELNSKEQITYTVIDSLGKEYKLDTYIKLSENLAQGIVDFKYVELDLNNVLTANLHEGFRIGLGVNTGDSLSKTFKLGGYYAYGFKDKKSKHGASLTIELNKDKESQIKFNYQDDVQDFGAFYNRNLGTRVFSQREFIVSEMNRLKQMDVSFKTRIFKYLQSEFQMAQHEFTPRYPYTYKGELLSPLKTTTLGVNLRFAYKEKYIQTVNQRISMGTKYPVLSLAFKTMEKGRFNNDYNLTALKLKMDYSWYWKNIGKTQTTIVTGKIFNELPAPLLFSGEGSLDKSLQIFVPRTFQTATPYEFMSNTYAHVFIRHNFGSLLFKTEKFKPQLSVVQNMGWSKLDNQEDHNFEAYKGDMSKGFLESGLILDNVLRINYINMGYLGFGVGVFGRYGAYAHDSFSDNLIYKISMIFTTK